MKAWMLCSEPIRFKNFKSAMLWLIMSIFLHLHQLHIDKFPCNLFFYDHLSSPKMKSLTQNF